MDDDERNDIEISVYVVDELASFANDINEHIDTEAMKLKFTGATRLAKMLRGAYNLGMQHGRSKKNSQRERK